MDFEIKLFVEVITENVEKYRLLFKNNFVKSLLHISFIFGI